MRLKRNDMRLGEIPGRTNTAQVVRPLCFSGDDAALAAALKADTPGAMESFYRRFAPYVQRILVSVVNVRHDMPELLQEVFIQAFASIGSLRDNSLLRTWLTSVAVKTARKYIQRKTRYTFFQRSLPDIEWPVTDARYEDREALRYTYSVLERMPVEERVVFSLRYIEEMSLLETAKACDVSLATVKRRLGKARKRFSLLAAKCPVLLEWLENSDHLGVTL
jgi:RNA polymerase sigma-70 factor (ECF subfamily)